MLSDKEIDRLLDDDEYTRFKRISTTKVRPATLSNAKTRTPVVQKGTTHVGNTTPVVKKVATHVGKTTPVVKKVATHVGKTTPVVKKVATHVGKTTGEKKSDIPKCSSKNNLVNEPLTLIGQGMRANVFGLINQPKVVIKMQPLGPHFHEEVERARQAARKALGPIVYDDFYCESKQKKVFAFIIMQRMTVSVGLWWKEEVFGAKDPLSRPKIIKKWSQDVNKVIKKMHGNQMIHGDLLPRNIMAFKKDQGGYSWRFVDWDTPLNGATAEDDVKLLAKLTRHFLAVSTGLSLAPQKVISSWTAQDWDYALGSMSSMGKPITKSWWEELIEGVSSARERFLKARAQFSDTNPMN